jgi:putative ABC transport system ATP-binding protein
MAEGVLELLDEINAAGTTIIMVTHDPDLAEHAKRQIRVKDGQIQDSVEN